MSVRRSVLVILFLTTVSASSARAQCPGFEPPRGSAPLIPPTSPWANNRADFDGDGLVDWVDTRSGYSIEVRLSNGDGTFETRWVLARRGTVSVGDIDGDGRADLAVLLDPGSISTGAGLEVYRNVGHGEFALASSRLLEAGVADIALADLNRDGILDLVLVKTGFAAVRGAHVFEPGKISVLLGRGDGSFLPMSTYGEGRLLFPLALADLDGDGIPDLVYRAVGYGILADDLFVLRLGRGDGSFSEPHLDPFPGAGAAAVADLDGDGQLELAVLGQDLALHRLSATAPPRLLVSEAVMLPFSYVSDLRFGDVDDDGSPDLLVYGGHASTFLRNRCGGGRASRTISLPVVLSSPGTDGTSYTTELTFVNRGSHPAHVTATYVQEVGGGSGRAELTLPTGQLSVPDGIEFLRGLGLPLPPDGPRRGTLQLAFTGLDHSTDAWVEARVTTPGPGGGSAAVGLAPTVPLHGPSYVPWLSEDAADRTNLALVNAGAAPDGPVTLRVTLHSTERSLALPDVRLGPGQRLQLDRVLATSGLGVARGWAGIERVGGVAPYLAYAVVNDRRTNDGSLVPATPVGATRAVRYVVPVAVESASYVSDLVLTNPGDAPRTVTVTYVADAIAGDDHSATTTVDVPAGEVVVLDGFVQRLRERGAAGIGPPGPTYSGALYVETPGGGILAGARTRTRGDGGFGVFQTAAALPGLAVTSAAVHGLRRDGTSRSSLAIVNVGDGLDPIRLPGGQEAMGEFQVTLFGPGGAVLRTLDPLFVGPHRSAQVALDALPDGNDAYALVTRISGPAPFLAYGVLNDGAWPGEGTGDGTVRAMLADPF